MRLVLDDTFLPAILNAPQMTDEDFANFCAERPDLFFEMTADGELIVTPPTHSLTGTRNTRFWLNWKPGRIRTDVGQRPVPPMALCSRTVPAVRLTPLGLPTSVFVNSRKRA